MNQELVFRRRRNAKILICLGALVVVVVALTSIIRSRQMVHESWEQSVEKMEREDSELREKLHHDDLPTDSRMKSSSVEHREETLAQ